MRRRGPRSRPETPGRGAEPQDDADGGGSESDAGESWAHWEEKWDRPEEERVARWLMAKVHPEADVDLRDQPRGPTSISAHPRSDASFVDAQRRRLAAALEAERWEAERVRQEQIEANQRLEAEVARLDEQRRRLAATVAAQREEAERLQNEQLEAKARVEAEMSYLDEQRQLLAAAVEAQRKDADIVRQEQEEVRARLMTELSHLDEQRLQLAAALEAERRQTENVHREQLETRATLEAKVSELQEQHHRLSADIETRPDELEVDVDNRKHEQLDARAKLAAAVSELAQHMAATRESQSAEAEAESPTEREAPAIASQRGREGIDERDGRRPATARAARHSSPLVPRWLLRTVLALGVLGVAGVEAGSPFVTRAQLETVARDAADAAVVAVLESGDVQAARQAAQTIASGNDAALKSLIVDHRGLRVVVEREAPSLLLKRWDRAKNWYDVEVTATASGAGSGGAPG